MKDLLEAMLELAAAGLDDTNPGLDEREALLEIQALVGQVL